MHGATPKNLDPLPKSCIHLAYDYCIRFFTRILVVFISVPIVFTLWKNCHTSNLKWNFLAISCRIQQDLLSEADFSYDLKQNTPSKMDFFLSETCYVKRCFRSISNEYFLAIRSKVSYLKWIYQSKAISIFYVQKTFQRLWVI